MAEDTVETLPNGKVRFHLGGKSYELRRPKVGEYREINVRLREAHDRIREQEAKEREAPKAETNGHREYDGIDEVYGWWQFVFETLAKPLEVPADDLPVFMVMSPLSGEVMAHWRASPLASSPKGPVPPRR